MTSPPPRPLQPGDTISWEMDNPTNDPRALRSEYFTHRGLIVDIEIDEDTDEESYETTLWVFKNGHTPLVTVHAYYSDGLVEVPDHITAVQQPQLEERQNALQIAHRQYKAFLVRHNIMWREYLETRPDAELWVLTGVHDAVICPHCLDTGYVDGSDGLFCCYRNCWYADHEIAEYEKQTGQQVPKERLCQCEECRKNCD